jgi:hypothetical protein
MSTTCDGGGGATLTADPKQHIVIVTVPTPVPGGDVRIWITCPVPSTQVLIDALCVSAACPLPRAVSSD